MHPSLRQLLYLVGTYSYTSLSSLRQLLYLVALVHIIAIHLSLLGNNPSISKYFVVIDFFLQL
jgi:hypothetical protein